MPLDRTLHIILGAGGAIGTPLALELLAKNRRLRTVSRSGAGPAGAGAVRADLTEPDAVMRAVEEGATVYLLAGLPYDRRVWQEQWPRIMRNVVGACESKGARLIFFDNVYPYGRVDGPMTEDTPVHPTSHKGKIRAEIAGYLQTEMAAGRITASIARAADFYGPDSEKTSIPSILIFPRLAAGKSAQVFVSADTRHSFTYTLDCAKALCLLADADDSFGQVWHLPTAHPALTGREFVELAAKALGVAPRVSPLPAWTMKTAGLVVRMMRELAEMLYQYDHDYVFDSSKFERRFGFVPTAYGDGIRATAQSFVKP
ncbi:MAG TPA: NAD-dependent epimerase/dehydratase family protein [Vicinamibacterales bacterium]|jgi:nucleoside-diphosphate-sugar epimerase